ncbi:MAG: hypothetical protein NTX79_05030 [Candidatus Micrarchaeota archaeon]|nr:hypothetical protein [Candidatus Micrarchaeota archaeon]
MAIHSIGKKMARACPGIYIAGAKIGTRVYWMRRFIGLDYEKTGKKVALLYVKYGNIALEKSPGMSEIAYHRAAKFAPKWKALIKKRAGAVFEKCELLA